MNTLLQHLSTLFGDAFKAAGLDRDYGAVVVSNRPEYGQFQCNGALPAASSHEPRLNPRALAERVIAALPQREIFAKVSVAGPGFINLSITDDYLAGHVERMAQDERLGVPAVEQPERVVLDYGGANAAKRMHVGHLRAAIIGDSLRRIAAFLAQDVIGDVHLGDWGTQMGQLMMEIKRRQPDLPYFDPDYAGPYPDVSPVTMDDLVEMYPQASARYKSDPDFRQAALQATVAFQNGRPGYVALLQHIIDVSIVSLREDYDRLGVHFDLWLGESDAAPRIPSMIRQLVQQGLAVESKGALVVPLDQPGDAQEIPPLMLAKSDGGYLYGTTDLATIAQRVEQFGAERILYVVDQRQALHFEQVFRAAQQSSLAGGAALEHLGFGTMNGPDGKPFKTRAGGVMTLNELMDMITERALSRLDEIEIAEEYDEQERQEIAHLVGLAALKFADLINHRSRDYAFDLERFSAFEGRTGPYLLYTAVRTKSILRKATGQGLAAGTLLPPINEHERELMLMLAQFPDQVWMAYENRAPNYLADYAYGLSMIFNRFYRACHILSEEDPARQASWLGLLAFFLAVLEKALALLGIDTPERM